MWGRPLRDTEVACLLSHRRAWSKVVAANRPHLVLEDDVVLSQQTRKLLSELYLLENVDIVNLECHAKPKRLGRKQYTVLVPGYTLSQIYRDRSGAAGYIIWPRGAEKLLAYTERLSPLADAALALTPGVVRYQLEPAAAIQGHLLPRYSSALGQSTITEDTRPRFSNLKDLLRGKLIRLGASWTILRNLISGFGKTSSRLVKFRV